MKYLFVPITITMLSACGTVDYPEFMSVEALGMTSKESRILKAADLAPPPPPVQPVAPLITEVTPQATTQPVVPAEPVAPPPPPGPIIYSILE